MPGLAILIAKKKPMDEDSDGGDEMDTKKVCMKITETLIDAVHDRDVETACKCLKDLVDLLKDGDDEEEAGDAGEEY